MDTKTTNDFFISYTHADQRWAEWIAWQLEAAGYTTTIQVWDFGAGSNFVDDMDTAARQAHRTIAVLSPDYFSSEFTFAEWEAAFRRDPRGKQGLLVPVRVRPYDVEGLLGQVVYIDLVDQDEKTACATLLRGVKQERHKPSTSPAFPFTAQITQTPKDSSFYVTIKSSPSTKGRGKRYTCSMELLKVPEKGQYLHTARPIRKARASLAIFLRTTADEKVALRAPQ